MSVTAFTLTALGLVVALVWVLVTGVATAIQLRKRRIERLHGRMAAQARAVTDGGNRQDGEAGFGQRIERAKVFHIRPLALGERARFLDSWRAVQARFVDGPAGAVAEADQLLGDVMYTRGYPVTAVEQRTADMSADHSLVFKNYRSAHDIARRQTRGEASTEDLRQAMVHYGTLFEELVHEAEAPLARAAS